MQDNSDSGFEDYSDNDFVVPDITVQKKDNEAHKFIPKELEKKLEENRKPLETENLSLETDMMLG